MTHLGPSDRKTPEELFMDGVMQCEQHPGTIFPHGDCPGPGMQLFSEPPENLKVEWVDAPQLD